MKEDGSQFIHSYDSETYVDGLNVARLNLLYGLTYKKDVDVEHRHAFRERWEILPEKTEVPDDEEPEAKERLLECEHVMEDKNVAEDQNLEPDTNLINVGLDDDGLDKFFADLPLQYLFDRDPESHLVLGQDDSDVEYELY